MTREFDEALQRARTHLRHATLEGLEAAVALVDAARIAGGDLGEAPGSRASQIARGLEGLIGALRDGQGLAFPTALTGPLSEALASEIARWEARSRTDPDARPVLRAFLGLRELLWELGLIRENPRTPGARGSKGERTSRSDRSDRREPDDAAARSKTHAPRVQRFDIEN